MRRSAHSPWQRSYPRQGADVPRCPLGRLRPLKLPSENKACPLVPVLAGSDNMMLGPLLWRCVRSSEMGQTSALALLMAAILLAVGALARKFVWSCFGA